MVSARGVVQVELKSIGGREKGRLRVEALVLPKISLELPMQQVQFDPKWNQLKGLTLADPDLGTPGRVNILIGPDVYCQTVLSAGSSVRQDPLWPSIRGLGGCSLVRLWVSVGLSKMFVAFRWPAVMRSLGGSGK